MPARVLHHEIDGDAPAASGDVPLLLGSSIGTAIAGTILVAGLGDANRAYGIAMIVVAFIALIGLGAAVLLPAAEPAPGADAPSPQTKIA